MTVQSAGVVDRAPYVATYSLSAEGTWQIRVETERGIARSKAARLVDVERRAYLAVYLQVGRPIGTFEVSFRHQADRNEPAVSGS